jgi:hypothetical protein
MDRAAFERRDGSFDESRFVQCVGVDRHLDVELIRHAQAAIDSGGAGAPVFVQLQANRPGLNLLGKTLRLGRIPFAGKSEVER